MNADSALVLSLSLLGLLAVVAILFPSARKLVQQLDAIDRAEAQRVAQGRAVHAAHARAHG